MGLINSYNEFLVKYQSYQGEDKVCSQTVYKDRWILESSTKIDRDPRKLQDLWKEEEVEGKKLCCPCQETVRLMYQYLKIDVDGPIAKGLFGWGYGWWHNTRNADDRHNFFWG